MRLIDADALNLYEPLKIYFSDVYRTAQDAIEAAPTIDAEKLIRCKDCARASGWDSLGICDIWKKRIRADFYCGFAVSKENNHELVE